MSLHEKLKENIDKEKIVLNRLTITGKFYISDMNAWIHSLFPDMATIDSEEENI